jgi:hypothetical protein
MAYQIRAAYQSDPSLLENTLELVGEKFPTEEDALEFIKENIVLTEINPDFSQVQLILDDKAYIYFEVKVVS